MCSANNAGLATAEGKGEEGSIVEAILRETKRGEPHKPRPGYKFLPSDEILIRNYLWRKRRLGVVNYNCFIYENVYIAHPLILYETHKEWSYKGRVFFFTTRDRKYPWGERPNRRTLDQSGYWKATGSDKIIPVYDRENPTWVGHKKTLVFYQYADDVKGGRTDWTMSEYTIRDVGKLKCSKARDRAPPPTQLDDCVLCSIQKKRSAKKDDDDDDEDDDEDEDSDWEVEEKRSRPRQGQEKEKGKNSVDGNETDAGANNMQIVLQQEDVWDGLAHQCSIASADGDDEMFPDEYFNPMDFLRDDSSDLDDMPPLESVDPDQDNTDEEPDSK